MRYLDLYLIPILFFIIPIIIYLICSRIIKKPLLNIPIFIVLLLGLMIWHIWGYNIRFGAEIKFAEDIRSFFHNDSVIAVWLMWLPAICGAVVANIVGLIKRRKK